MRSRRFLPILFVALAALLAGACDKASEAPDVPRGAALWALNVAMACTTSVVDPAGGQVSYQFDWDDGTPSEWSPDMASGVSFAGTHTYAKLGSFNITVRAKYGGKTSAWSDPLKIKVADEGAVGWSFAFLDADEDSADFSLNSFAIGPDNTAYVGCSNGAVIARRQSNSFLKFIQPDPSEFYAAPVLADDGTIFIGCSNDTIYILNSDLTVKSRVDVGGEVNATGALGADGTAYFQTADSIVALRSDGTTLWTFPSGGGSAAPVVGTDGTVYVVNQDGMVYALNPGDSTPKWSYNLIYGAVQAPAIDPSRNRLYAVNDVGSLQTIDLTTGLGSWSYSAGEDASGPVVGPDGSVFIGGGGKLTKLNPDFDTVWTFSPPFTFGGMVSTPAVTDAGYVYVLVVPAQKGLDLQEDVDTLYAVNPDGTRRWACGLGEAVTEAAFQLSAPKVGATGLIYVGDGTQCWCVVGVSAPAQSAWPMFQHDARNTGRAQ